MPPGVVLTKASTRSPSKRAIIASVSGSEPDDPPALIGRLSLHPAQGHSACHKAGKLWFKSTPLAFARSAFPPLAGEGIRVDDRDNPQADLVRRRPRMASKV